MKTGLNDLDTRRAVAGEYLPPSDLLKIFSVKGSPQGSAPTDEQKFYDWCTDLSEDSGVVGNLSDERLYLDTALSGRLQVGGESYYFEMSRTSVNFASEKPIDPPIGFSGVGVETEGSEIEATQVGKAFVSIRQQAILNRVWASSTSLTSIPAVGISEFRLGEGRSQALMTIETGLGECTVSIRRGPQETFRYSVFLAAVSAELSPRIADALLADVAEDLGASPVPESIPDPMFAAAERARTDQEWLNVGVGGGRARRA